MCLVALLFRIAADAPVVVGANREEVYARGGEPPRLLGGSPRVVAGLDPVAGGTWLGVNEHGVLVAVTNRRKSQPPDRPRSRGLLVREMLACPTAAAAVTLATRELDGKTYAGCNVLCADADRAVVLQAGDWLRVRPLPPGLHVLTNGDVNDASDARAGHALGWLHRRAPSRSAECLKALCELCGQPEVLVEERDRGTVSSSVIAVRPAPNPVTYLHAQGSPGRTAYADYSSLLTPSTR